MTFAYHRSLSPIVGVLLALSLIETLALHVVAIAYWGWKIAFLLGLADVSLVIFLVRLLRSFRTMPITLVDDVLTMRAGHSLEISIPVDQIGPFREQWSADELKNRTVLNLALAAWLNLMFDLKHPIKRRWKDVTSVAHCVDDPLAFRSAVQAAARRFDPTASDG